MNGLRISRTDTNGTRDRLYINVSNQIRGYDEVGSGKTDMMYFINNPNNTEIKFYSDSTAFLNPLNTNVDKDNLITITNSKSTIDDDDLILISDNSDNIVKSVKYSNLTSGISGSSGTSGTDGTSGNSGTPGTDGTSGSSGIDGGVLDAIHVSEFNYNTVTQSLYTPNIGLNGDILLYGSSERNIKGGNDGEAIGTDINIYGGTFSSNQGDIRLAWDGTSAKGYVGIRKGASSSYGLDVSGSIRTDANLYVGSDIIHDGDSNTYISFGLDKIDMYAGGIAMLSLVESTGDYVGIKDTSPSYDLDVNGSIRATGDVISNSDIRLKENISEMDSIVDKIKQLEPVNFTWKESNKQDIGLIAQDVEKIIPELVYTDNKGYKSISYQKLSVILLKALKEIIK
jgi:hypothetical protein